MTIEFSNDKGFFWGARATLIEDGNDGKLKAWAEKHVRKDADIGWILGNFVEAENANLNGHIFPTDDLVNYSVHTLASKPLNMLHHEKYITGSFAGGEIVAADPDTVVSADAPGPPVMEALSGFWRRIFPEEYGLVQRANKEGTLFYSMEAVPPEITCPECSNRYAFAGLQHESYCEHLNASRISAKILHQPRFEGGAVIIPPVQPGWTRADAKTLAELVKQNEEGAEKLYAGISQEFDHLDPNAWEDMMNMVLLHSLAEVQARDFSQQQRDSAAKKGHAMPDGSFPIITATDLKNAISAVGRAKDPAAAKAHIKKRAKALGLEKLLPEGW